MRGWGCCRLRARVPCGGQEGGEQLGRAHTQVCVRGGAPFGVPGPPAPPHRLLGRRQAAQLDTKAQQPPSVPACPIRQVHFKGANGEGWAGPLIAGPERCQRLPPTSQRPRPSPPQACKQNRFQLCSYLGLWLWKALLAPLTGERQRSFSGVGSDAAPPPPPPTKPGAGGTWRSGAGRRDR